MKVCDYEYKFSDGFARIEKGGNNNWVWRVFFNNGDYECSNNLGEHFSIKRECKASVTDFLLNEGIHI